MSWTAPMTAVAGSVYTAAQFNTFVRDNLLETAPAKATTTGSLFVGTGVNTIAERIPAKSRLSTGETTTSTSYTNLATVGPTVTVTTGTDALVLATCTVQNNTSGTNVYSSYEISGATTVAATDDRAIFITTAAANQGFRASIAYFEDALTPGSNTFTAKYRVISGTGTFTNRMLTVIPL
jgi:hypothetical protein